MAIISLRAYIREIEGLIDASQLDEAVAHCRHILTTFPKYIASYRLLGKAHLEQQRISDATDIFQRVLSAIPDDFVANVGMSIIREDENNLDAAIWHMELAYESQPSNAAIQDELRRLYGRRDGMQPPKLRLTRGALARMYSKGGLFEQAVSELRAAIAEDPNRTDLQLLLAQMYFELSQNVEAVDLCINILKKLPYCLAANQVLAVCLPESVEGDAGRNYRQTAISMDPYFAHAGQDAISSDQVPDNAVNLERYEWKSGLQVEDVSSQPAWATSLGISMEKPSEQPIPDWLKEAEMPAANVESETAKSDVTPFLWDNKELENIISEAPKPDEEMPDWLKDAGWKSASEEKLQEEEEEAIEQPPAEELETEELEKAEIPDWLRGLAPEGVLDDKPSEPQPEEKDISIPWLEKQEPGPTDSIIQWLEGREPEMPAVPPEKPVSEQELMGEEIPDWLKDMDVSYPQPVEEEAGGIPPATPAFIDEPVEERAPLEELIGLSSTDEQLTSDAESLPVEQADETRELPAEGADDVPDWIKALAAELPASYAAEIPGGEAEQEAPGITGEKAFIEESPAREQASIDESIYAAEVIEETTTAEIPPDEEMPTIEQPSIEAEPPNIALTPVETEPIPEDAEPPEESLLSEFKAFADEPVELQEITSTEAEQTGEIEPAAAEMEESAWLKNLAGDVETGEAEFTPPHGTPVEELLERVDLDENALPGEAPAEEQPAEEEAPTLPAVDIPDWIRGLGEDLESEELTPGAGPEAVEPEIIESEPFEPEADESITVEPETVEPLSLEPELTEAFAAESEALPSWLEDMEPEQAQAVSPAPGEEVEGKDEELPDWIKEIAASAPVSELTPWEESVTDEAEVQAAEEPVPETVEPALEWTPESAEDVVPSLEEEEEAAPETVEPALEWMPEAEADVVPSLEEEEEAASETVEPALEWMPEADADVVPSLEEADVTAPTTIEPPLEWVSAEITAAVPSEEQAEETLPEVPAWVMEVLEAEEQEAKSVDVPLEAAMESKEPVIEADEIPSAAIAEESASTLPEAELTSLEEARAAIAEGLPDQAVELYSMLIRKNYHLEELVKDLQEASYRFPLDVKLQVALGDAYFHKGEAQEALDAYTRAEELVR